MTISKLIGVALLGSASLVSATLAQPAAEGGRKFTTELTGEAEVTAAGVPNQGDLDGSGTATITLNSGQGEVCWEISVSDITLPAAAAHIHVGPATTTGPVVVPLSAPDAAGVSSGCISADRDL